MNGIVEFGGARMPGLGAGLLRHRLQRQHLHENTLPRRRGRRVEERAGLLRQRRRDLLPTATPARPGSTTHPPRARAASRPTMTAHKHSSTTAPTSPATLGDSHLPLHRLPRRPGADAGNPPRPRERQREHLLSGLNVNIDQLLVRRQDLRERLPRGRHGVVGKRWTGGALRLRGLPHRRQLRRQRREPAGLGPARDELGEHDVAKPARRILQGHASRGRQHCFLRDLPHRRPDDRRRPSQRHLGRQHRRSRRHGPQGQLPDGRGFHRRGCPDLRAERDSRQLPRRQGGRGRRWSETADDTGTPDPRCDNCHGVFLPGTDSWVSGISQRHAGPDHRGRDRIQRTAGPTPATSVTATVPRLSTTARR